jgi:uncharacterized protein
MTGVPVMEKAMKVQRFGLTSIFFFALWGSLPIESTAMANDRDDSLIDAVEKGDISRVRQLISAGGTLQVVTKNGASILSLAVQGEHTEIVKLLLQKGARPQADEPVLMWLLSKKNLPLFKILVEAGLDVNYRFPMQGEWKSWTPLMIATSLELPEFVEILLRKEAKVDLQADDILITALHIAAANNQKEIVKLLIASKADTTIEDMHFKTPLDYARENGSTVIVELLEQARRTTKK